MPAVGERAEVSPMQDGIKDVGLFRGVPGSGSDTFRFDHNREVKMQNEQNIEIREYGNWYCSSTYMIGLPLSSYSWNGLAV